MHRYRPHHPHQSSRGPTHQTTSRPHSLFGSKTANPLIIDSAPAMVIPSSQKPGLPVVASFSGPAVHAVGSEATDWSSPPPALPEFAPPPYSEATPPTIAWGDGSQVVQAEVTVLSKEQIENAACEKVAQAHKQHFEIVNRYKSTGVLQDLLVNMSIIQRLYNEAYPILTHAEQTTPLIYLYRGFLEQGAAQYLIKQYILESGLDENGKSRLSQVAACLNEDITIINHCLNMARSAISYRAQERPSFNAHNTGLTLLSSSSGASSSTSSGSGFQFGRV